MMSYSETLDFIYNRLPLFQMVGSSAYKVGLDSMIAFDNRLGNPHKSFKTIHVGGTNGKGSVSHTLASVLQSAGYKVGLFTSPHLKDFRERIRVNGEVVPEDFVIRFVETHRQFFDEVYPSFFEVNFAMALDYFREQEVDVAVIEVGLGGRLDSTNIITPELCVITNISMDHTNILGETEEAIATEKAGIIKAFTPVVIGEANEQLSPIFKQKAESVQAPIFFADERESHCDGFIEKGGTTLQKVNIEGKAVLTPLLGSYQAMNMRTATLAVSKLREIRGFEISEEAELEGIEKTIEQTHLLGRWQKLGEKPLTICDTGHNVGGIKYVVEQLQRTPHEKLHIVFGMVGDKDVSHVLELLPKDATYYFTKASTKRAMNEVKMQGLAAEKGLIGDCYPTVQEALHAAQANAQANDLIYIGGSTYVVAEII